MQTRLSVWAHCPLLPVVLPTNVQSLQTKLDDLRTKLKYQRDICDYNNFCLTEIWLTMSAPDHAILLNSFQYTGWTKCQTLAKTRGVDSVYMVNKNWCDSKNVAAVWRYCSPDLEFITKNCRPYYLPREFTSINVANDVYIPPRDTDKALIRLHETLGRHQTDDLDAALIVTDYFNKPCLKRVMPNLY